MSTLQIRKLQSGAFKHVDSIDGDFFLGRFNFKQEFNKAFLVEAYGAKRRQYSITEVEVFDFGGTAETFTNWTDLINRLVDLGYTGIDTNSIPSGGGVWGSIIGSISSQTDLQNELNTKLDKVTTTDVEKVYIKNADGTQGMKPVSDFGGGGADYLYENIRWIGFDSTTLNTWKSTTPYVYRNDTGFIADFGTGLTPIDGYVGYFMTLFYIPDGYKIESIKLGVNLILGVGNLQVYIDRGEVGDHNTGPITFNAFNLVNEVVNITTLSDRPKFIHELTVAPQSPITLAHGFLKIAVRETTNPSIHYGLNFNVIYKKI